MISAVIPAYNEGERIEKVLIETRNFVDEIIVIDDCSTDDTAKKAENYADVLQNEGNVGYLESIKKGFEHASGDILVTLDADGEHAPKYIPDMVEPIKLRKADLVFGRRESIPRPSERFLSKIAELKVKTVDTGTGYRALRKELAEKLELNGYCTCGIFALEAYRKGADITEVKAPTRKIKKSKGVAWIHFFQFFKVIIEFLRS